MSVSVHLPTNLQACLFFFPGYLVLVHTSVSLRLSARQPARDEAIARHFVAQQFSSGLLLKNNQVFERRDAQPRTMT